MITQLVCNNTLITIDNKKREIFVKVGSARQFEEIKLTEESAKVLKELLIKNGF